MRNDEWIVVRGGGDIATGAIQKLHRAGFKVLVLEIAEPTAIRRLVAVSEAIYDGKITVEDFTAVRVRDLVDAYKAAEQGLIPVIVDPNCSILPELKPDVVVDVIIAKRNTGMLRSMAPGTIGVGPGFFAGEDADIVIESMRGHDLGRLIFEGPAMPDTSTPGLIGGYDKERVVHSPAAGKITNLSQLGDVVEAGQSIATVDGVPVRSPLTGVLRGLIRSGITVTKGMKIADVDPRKEEVENSELISDKARTIGGGVLEAVMILLNRNAG
ncbi:MAG TPA: selenium-dependent molybdenum cofactor biosynthesis protein YqeB [Bellilinea sp.]|nr:selenium-dependent molybdenum cofactor biosynthesis protein YqeB [Bellilinea sp.]